MSAAEKAPGHPRDHAAPTPLAQGRSRAACHATRARLRAYVRAALTPAQATRVSAHLECCRSCTELYLAAVERGTSTGSGATGSGRWRRAS